MTAHVLARPAAEVRRLRAELARVTAERDQYRALYLADPGAVVPLAIAEEWARDEYRRGHRDGSETSGPVVLLDVDEPSPYPNEQDRQRIAQLDRERYPPNGRARFAEPREGDYQGGRVEWEPKAGAVA